MLRVAIAGPSGQEIYKGANAHLENMVKLVDSVVDEFDCDILLISHHTVTEYPIKSDLEFYETIFQSLKNKHRVHVVREELNAEETKSVIGQTDIFIGGKLHSCINSLSQCVPTVAISYSFKFLEIMAMMGQEQLVVQEFGVEETLNKIRYAWVNREGIRQELELAMKDIGKQAITNEKILSSILLKYYNRVA